MANDGKIYITISDHIVSEDGITPTPTPTPEPEEKKKKTGWDLFKDQFVRFAEQQANQAVNYTIQNIGNFTGNYLAQTNTQANLGALKSAISIGTAFLVNPVAGAFAVASTAINFALSDYTAAYNNKKQNREISILRERSGLDTLTNGSR